MYTRPAIEEPVPEEVLAVSFNKDASHFVVGLTTGYAVFKTDSCSLASVKDLHAPMALAEMFEVTNFLAVVGRGQSSHFSSNKVVIWDNATNAKALDISLLRPVRGVLLGTMLGQKHIVVVLQDSVRLYNFKKKPDFVTQYETTNNSLGLCCMSDRLLALPGNSAGHVQLVDRATKTINIIPAHTSALRAIQLSQDGELLATASDKGTLIRVWSTKTRAKVAELRRGLDPSTIFHLAFNPSATMLACTSDKSTLHIFDMPHANQPQSAEASVGDGTSSSPEDGKTKWGFLSNIPFMPRVFSDVYSSASAAFEYNEGVASRTQKPQQGVIGWIDDDTLTVVGAGRDAKWEKFVIRTEYGRRECVREGWKYCRTSD